MELIKAYLDSKNETIDEEYMFEEFYQGCNFKPEYDKSSQKYFVKKSIEKIEKEIESLELSQHNWRKLTKMALCLVIVLNLIAAFVEVSIPIGFIPIPAVIYTLFKHTDVSHRILETKHEIEKLYGIIFDINSSEQA